MKEVLDLLSELRTRGISVSLDESGSRLKVKGQLEALDEPGKTSLHKYREEIIAMLKHAGGEPSPIIAAQQQSSYPLTSTQSRFWILSQHEEANSAYNIYTASFFTHRPDADRLERCIQWLIRRHEILRTVFRQEEDGTLCQCVQDIDETKFSLAAADPSMAEFIRRPFDLSAGPLLRAGLFAEGNDQWGFVFVMHHIIGDGWSIDVLMKELLFMYESKEPDPYLLLPALPFQYKDYAVWQQQQQDHPALQKQRSYWLQQLEGELPVLSLITDSPRPAIRTYSGARVSFSLPQTIKESLTAIGRQQRVSTFMTLLAAVNTWVYRYTGQTDIIIGTPVAGREQIGLQFQVGPYLNMLALRTRPDGGENFIQLLAKVRTTVLDAYRHQDYPFDSLVDDLHAGKDRSRNPLFDLVVVFRDNTVFEAGVQANIGNPVSKFDLTIYFTDEANALQTDFEYNTDLFEEATIRQFAEHLIRVLETAIRDPHLPISSLDYLSDDEKRQLLVQFNATGSVYPKDCTVIDLFEQQIMRTPDNTAIVCDGRMLTYRQLNSRASRLACYLQEVYTPAPDTVIGIYLPRTEWMVIAILGILRSGAAYMPIDREYPQQRVQFMIEDSACRLVIDEEELTRFQAQEEKYNDKIPGTVGGSGDLSYLIYTSGSTGRPKGVMVESRALVNLCFWHRKNFSVTAADRATLYAGVGFDAAVWELFPYLLAGASLYIVPDDLRLDIAGLAAFYDRQGISISFLPTQVAEQFMRQDNSSLRCLLTGGDKLSRFEKKRYRIFNNYGPTENTVVTTSGEVLCQLGNIPIGKPIANTRVYVLDANRMLCPAGVAGEIYIGGDSLCRGYLNQPGLNAEKFINAPFSGAERLYRTGDLGRWLSDGDLEFLGRADQQIKIRGHRIEPGEVEAALASCPGIESAIVMAKNNKEGAKELVAYFRSSSPLQMADLRTQLGRMLPAFMIPARIIRVDAFPLTPNGKLDKEALPDAWPGDESAEKGPAPEGPTEERLASIWKQLLGIPYISRKDDFFMLGGHSLKITRLRVCIAHEFGMAPAIKELFIHTVLEDQALLIERSAAETTDVIPPCSAQTDYPLSSGQQRLWILSRSAAHSLAYTIPAVYEFNGPLDIPALERSIWYMTARHEILRTIFFEDEKGQVRQKILDPQKAANRVSVTDLQDNSAGIAPWITEIIQHPFDLSTGPLMRIRAGKIDKDKWLLVFTMHHVIGDGWSMDILFRELLQCYGRYVASDTPQMEPLTIQYRDYAVWQQESLAAGKWVQYRQYWLRQLDGYPVPPELPSDRNRTPDTGYHGSEISLMLEEDVTGALMRFSGEKGATLFMGLLAALSALLFRRSGQGDRVIGSPVAGRDLIALQEQIGCYINTLPLRIRIHDGDNFHQLLDTVRQVTLDGYEHQVYPFDRLLEDLDWPLEKGRNPLFDVMMLYVEDGDRPDFPFPVIERTEEPATSKFDLCFLFHRHREALELKIGYRSDLYDRDTVSRMAVHFACLLKAMLSEPETAIHRFEYLPAEEKELILHRFNHTAAAYPMEKTLPQLFYDRCGAMPDAIALVFRGRTFTYQEIREEACRFGSYLRTRHNIQREDLVAVCLEKSERMILAVMGTLIVGGAYLPVDPGHPEERMSYIRKDSRCKVWVDEQEWDRFYTERDSYPDTLLPLVNFPGDLAYIIYTSGSTGKPKGCMLEHRGVINRIEWMHRCYGFSPDDIILQKTNYTFDVSVWELFLPLCWGARMVLCEEKDLLSPERILSLIADQRVTCLHFVPGMLAAFIACLPGHQETRILLATLRRVITSGEALPLSTVRDWYHRIDIPIHNLYGPTEASIDVTAFTTSPEDTRIPIGRPISNTCIYILDADLRLQPVGVPGEICLAGDGLARGYLHRPELTAEKFVTNPVTGAGRIYRTGDLGRWLADGNIEYLGRMDQQVKIRGYRVELGEIENELLAHEEIVAATVIVVQGAQGDQELEACLVSTRPIETRELRSWLARSLPGYMIPQRYWRLPSLPLTASGKIDRRALPGAEAVELTDSIVNGGPRDEVETALADIWKELLGRKVIGIQDHFFESGGHSLKAMRLANSIREVFRVRISLDEIFTCPVLEQQASLIRHSQLAEEEPIPVVQQAAGYELSDQQRRLWIICRHDEANAAYNMADACWLEGNLDRPALERAFAFQIRRHEILRTVFRESYPGHPVQVVLSPEDSGFKLADVDLRHCEDAESVLQGLIRADFDRPFQLDAGPLLHVSLYRLAEGRWALSYVMHHIISDGWSMGVLLREIVQLYGNESGGHPSILRPLAIQYKDYAAWYNRRLHGEFTGGIRDYWLAKMTPPAAVITLPSDHPRHIKKTYSGDTLSFLIGNEDLVALQRLGQQTGTTLYMMLTAMLKILFFKYTGHEDIVTGVPVAGREHPVLEDQIGFYVNTLVLRDRVRASDSFLDVLAGVKQTMLEAFRHQAYPFGRLVEDLKAGRDGSGNPLFAIMIVLQDDEHMGLPPFIKGGSLKITPLACPMTTSRFDLNFNMVLNGEGLAVRIEYNTSLYEQTSILILRDKWLRLLHAVQTSPHVPIHDIPVDTLTSDCREQPLWDMLA